MGKRGRISEASRHNLVVFDGGFKRPDPPEDMTDVQKQIWRETVRTEPPEFFNTTVLQTLLRSYCCLVRQCRPFKKKSTLSRCRISGQRTAEENIEKCKRPGRSIWIEHWWLQQNCVLQIKAGTRQRLRPLNPSTPCMTISFRGKPSGD